MSAPTLADEQKSLVAHSATEHARVLAGPGTGKSFTLVAFLERLLALPFPPKVKLLTFTRAATAELAEKVAGHPAAGAEKPSTVHSFAISVLLRNPGTATFPEPLRIADNWEARNVVEPTLSDRSGFGLLALRDLISKMAANWESLTEVDFGVSDTDKARYLGAWNEHRRVFGYTLLAELPYAFLHALENHDDLKGIDFDLLLVDEYQDLNACDLALLAELGKRGCAIIGAGDDDQSIYSNRHADPAGIRRFLTDYSGASDYPLSVTLRCGKRIIEWANFVIAGDVDRPPERMPLSPRHDSPDGEVALLRFKGDRSEAKGVAALAEQLINRDGLRASELLVLLRSDHNGTFSKPIREELEKLGIECSDPGYVQELLADPDNRRSLAVLRLLVEPRDSLAWGTLLKLAPGIGAKFFEYVYELALPSRQTFAEALVEAHGAGYPDAPKASAGKASELVGNLLPLARCKPSPRGATRRGLEFVAGRPHRCRDPTSSE